MTDNEQPVNGSRRTFFRNLAALGVASGGAALIYRQGFAGQDEPTAVTQTGGKGYHETAHIRKYYDTARG